MSLSLDCKRNKFVKVKGVYENGVFVGSISYFNTQLQEYLVKFDDGSEDYICEDDIDGVELILM